jgi:hypothetical protein
MREVVSPLIMTSVDGYQAGPNGELDWAGEHQDDDGRLKVKLLRSKTFASGVVGLHYPKGLKMNPGGLSKGRLRQPALRPWGLYRARRMEVDAIGIAIAHGAQSVVTRAPKPGKE